MTLEYNGYTFSDQSHVDVKTEFVYDDSGRTVKYHKLHITVDSTIVPEPGDTNVADHMLRVRQKLSKTGGVLRLSDAGFDLEINYYKIRDVAFGPKPRILDWTPVGNTFAAEIRWECEACVPVCEGSGAGPRYNGLASLNYAIDYAVNSKGFSTRTVTGSLTVAMTRTGRAIPDTADRYREIVVISKPDDFMREQQDWKLSADKTRADFTVVDRQIESRNPYPPGVVAIRATHRAGWTRRHRAYLPNTISAEIELAHDQPYSRAWEIFKAIVNKRVNTQAYSKHPVILEGLEVEEELFGTVARFSISYRILAEIGELFNETRMFQPLGFDWNYWAQSIAAMTGPRGIAQMRHSANEDRITDLCDTARPTAAQPIPLTWTPPSIGYSKLCNQKPSAEKSWLRFEASLSEDTEWGTIYQTTLGSVDVEKKGFNPADPDPLLNTIVDGDDVETIVAERSPEMRWRWKGYAERAGYNIIIPDLLKIGDVELKRSGKRMFAHKHLGTHFCVPIYGAAWNIEYRVTKRPKKIGTENPDPASPAFVPT